MACHLTQVIVSRLRKANNIATTDEPVIITLTTKGNKMEPIIICPKCGGPTRYYHGPGTITRVVCKGTCEGWYVIKEYDSAISTKKLKKTRKL